MDPAFDRSVEACKGLPRASGDGPKGDFRGALQVLAAPRERGWTLRASFSEHLRQGCPARAGMDPRLFAAAN